MGGQRGAEDFNAMLHKPVEMPRVQILTDRASIQKYGGEKMLLAPPLAYDAIMKTIPWGSVTTVGAIRAYLAQKYDADFTDPITAGIFVSLAAWASHQRSDDQTPYWRVLKANGELNAKYPGGVTAQKERLEAEGHTVVQKGRTHLRYVVKDYQAALYPLNEPLNAGR